MQMNVYLNNCGEFPYVDHIQYLNSKLKIFLNFIGLKQLPQGAEVIINKPRHLIKPQSISEKDPFDFVFIPKLFGKIYFTVDLYKEKPEMPLIVAAEPPDIIAVNPPNVHYNYKLQEVSPWLVSHSGGFLERDFDGQTQLGVQWFDIYDLEDFIVIQFMTNNFYRNRLLYRTTTENIDDDEEIGT